MSSHLTIQRVAPRCDALFSPSRFHHRVRWPVRAVILLVVLAGCGFALCSCGDSATSSSRTSSAHGGVASAADAQYADAFRQDYVKVVSTLNAVSAACDHTLTTATLPACGKRVAA